MSAGAPISRLDSNSGCGARSAVNTGMVDEKSASGRTDRAAFNEGVGTTALPHRPGFVPAGLAEAVERRMKAVPTKRHEKRTYICCA